MIATNKDKLVKISVVGQIDSPHLPPVPWTPHLVSRDGQPSLLPLVGSIVYNVCVGDLATGWLGDVIEPGVSIRSKDPQANRALKVYSCIGNEAVVMSGMAKGNRGTVVGKSGRFADHIIVDFERAVLEELAIGDTILVRAIGLGLELQDFSEVLVKNVDPGLLEKLNLEAVGGKLRVPVVATLPAEVMGAGSGLDSNGGGLQIQSGAPGVMEQHGLGNLRLGDLIAVQDYECRFAPGFRRGAVSIGVVCHTDSVRPGYGPGMTMIMTAWNGELELVQDQGANIARTLGIGVYR